MAEIEAAFRRISSYKDVMGVMVIDKDREVVRTSLDANLSAEMSSSMPELIQLAGSMIRELDPQNDLKFLRLQSFSFEIMVAPYPGFSIVVLQHPKRGDENE